MAIICPKCRSDKTRFIMDYKHMLTGKLVESLFVCDNCYQQFKKKYKYPGPKST